MEAVRGDEQSLPKAGRTGLPQDRLSEVSGRLTVACLFTAATVLKELGCDLFLEMPPGHTLSDLAKEKLPGINSLPVEASVLPRVLRLTQMQMRTIVHPNQSVWRGCKQSKRLEVPKRKAMHERTRMQCNHSIHFKRAS